MSLCEKLQEMKQKSQQSYQTIADKSGVPLPTVKRIFSGQTPDPSYTTVCLLIKAMEIPPEETVGLYEAISSATADTVNALSAADARLIDLYERSIDTKNKWIRLLLILCLTLISIFIFILIWDVCNPHIGFFRFTMESINNGLLYFVNQLHC